MKKTMGRFEKEENVTSRNGKTQITEIENLTDSVDSSQTSAGRTSTWKTGVRTLTRMQTALI